MAFGEFLLVVCGLIVLVGAVGMCTKCRGGHSGQADFSSTPANESNKRGQENTAVVVGND